MGSNYPRGHSLHDTIALHPDTQLTHSLHALLLVILLLRLREEPLSAHLFRARRSREAHTGHHHAQPSSILSVSQATWVGFAWGMENRD